MLFDKLACLTMAGVSGLVIDAQTGRKVEHLFVIPADVLCTEGAGIEFVLSLRTRIGNDYLVVGSCAPPEEARYLVSVSSSPTMVMKPTL